MILNVDIFLENNQPQETFPCLLWALSYLHIFSLMFSLCLVHTLSKGEENLLIPVHAYPVIDDLQIPPHIDLSAVPLGQRCVCVSVSGSSLGCFLTSHLPEGFPVSLYSSIQPTMLPFTRWCQLIRKIFSFFFFHLSLVFPMLFLWDAAAPLTLSFRCTLFSPMRTSPSILFQVLTT